MVFVKKQNILELLKYLDYKMYTCYVDITPSSYSMIFEFIIQMTCEIHENE